jgi:hypothetical protein
MRAVTKPSATSLPDEWRRNDLDDPYSTTGAYGASIDRKTGVRRRLPIKEAWHFWTNLISAMVDD